MRSPVPSARWAEGERPRGLLGHELDMQVREMHLNLPSTVTHSPGGGGATLICLIDLEYTLVLFAMH